MNKKTLLAGIAALALFSSAAMAEGWNGAYVGLTGGFGMGQSDFTGTGALVPSEENPNSEGTIDTKGALFGGQIGYDYEVGNGFVAGLVADYSSADINGKTCADDDNCTGVDAGHTYALSSADWLATVRGKLGVNVDQTLLYVTGGVAMSDVNSTVTNLDGADSFDLSKTKGMTGWTAGAGINVKLADHMDVGAEYLYVDLGSANFDYVWPVEVTGGAKGDLTMHVVRASLNYRF